MAASALLLLIACLGAIGDHRHGRAVGAGIFGGFAAASAFLAWRGRLLGVVDIGPDALRVSGSIRTRVFRWGDIAGVEVREMSLPFLAEKHRVLVVLLRDGRSIALKATNARKRPSETPSWVDQAASSIQARLPAA